MPQNQKPQTLYERIAEAYRRLTSGTIAESLGVGGHPEPSPAKPAAGAKPAAPKMSAIDRLRGGAAATSTKKAPTAPSTLEKIRRALLLKRIEGEE